MDGLMIATGNDFRAVEAACHAYSCRKGRYGPLATWSYQDGFLQGCLIAPIAVGVVGGMTVLHPLSRLSLELLGGPSASSLAQNDWLCWVDSELRRFKSFSN